MIAKKTVQEFLAEVASSSPAPGGGGAVALTGATAAALVAMVGRVTVGRREFADVRAPMEEIIAEADRLREQLIGDVERDGRAYSRVVALGRGEDRPAYLEALREATLVPLEIAERSARVAELGVKAGSRCNPHAIGDAGAAVLLARGSARGALFPVRANLSLVGDPDFSAGVYRRIEGILKLCEESEREIERILSGR